MSSGDVNIKQEVQEDPPKQRKCATYRYKKNNTNHMLITKDRNPICCFRGNGENIIFQWQL